MSKIWNKGKGIPPGRSKCVKCGKNRNNKTSFKFCKSRYDRNGYRARNNSTCIPCEKKQGKILYKLHKEFGHLKPDNGTPCPLCNRLVENKDGVSNKWCLDHDHETHEYRGWICHKCNNAIGRLNEDAQTALNIYNYLLEKK